MNSKRPNALLLNLMNRLQIYSLLTYFPNQNFRSLKLLHNDLDEDS